MGDFLNNHLPRLTELEAIIGYRFKDPGLLLRALIHKSFANENPTLSLSHNESLEFVGDSVLGFIISTHLYQLFPQFSEGEYSRLRGFLVSGEHLVQLARDLKLGNFLLLGKGEAKTGGSGKKNILIDTLEALIAAIFFDGGLRPARAFVHRIFRASFKKIRSSDVWIEDFKTQLQEFLADAGAEPPRYILTGEEGPDHDKTFFVTVLIPSGQRFPGQGRSKKEAQQMAARNALAFLEHDPQQERSTQ